MPSPSVVALIPARSGSRRTPHKNVRELAGHPLLAYTIAAARQSGVFTEVYVSTDSYDYAEIAGAYGARAIKRPPGLATDASPDIEWVRHALQGVPDDAFAILRPTSPFRTAATIRRAWAEFRGDATADSLRAVRRVTEHPGKMWDVTAGGNRMAPFWPEWYRNGVQQPYHSMPTQLLPPVHVQSAALEIAWARTVRDTGTISGVKVRPFLMDAWEELDINSERDFLLAELAVARGLAVLPDVRAEAGVR